MSRIDQLLSIVENLERKTECILSTFQTTNDISNKLDHLNDQLSTFDIRINDTNNLIIKKFEFLNGYNDLLLRTNMFELNVHNNDPLTNQHILLNLDHEYQQLKAKYGVEDKQSFPSQKFQNVEMFKDPVEIKSPMKSRSQKLRASLSISNLSLKPIKCKPNKVYKKKSHYKISNVFDKPVVSPIVEQQSTFDDSLENSKESDFSIDFSEILDREKSIQAESLTESLTVEQNLQEVHQTQLDDDFNTQNISHKSTQSIESNHFNSLSQQNLQNHHLHSIQTDLSHSNDSSNSLLDRLDSDTPDTFTSENAIDEIFDINSEPMIKSTNFEMDVFDDNESTILNESNFENFENYLRKSRINLNLSSYPYILKTTTSESSINFKTDLFDGVVINNDSFSSDDSKNQQLYSDPASPTPVRMRLPEIPDIDRFHNPIDNLKIANESVTPTIEQIYSTFNSEGDTKTLLNKVMNNTPSKPFLFLGLLNDKETKEPMERRKSVGSSLNNFLSLMTSEPPKQIQGITKLNLDTGKKNDPPTPGQRRRKRINKLDELKNVPKTNPITVLNDLQIKRLPPSLTCLSPKSLSTRTLSSSSKVIIDSNKSFVIHGEKSIFNTPVISNFSNRSLQDALHSSLSY